MSKHLTFSNVVASIALFSALGGTAIAAKVLITKSSQLRNGVVTNKKVKKGTLRVDRLHTSARKALRGNRGPQGEPGPQGPAGASGAAAWDSPLPSGETIRGLWGVTDIEPGGAGATVRTVVSFPVAVPQAIEPPSDGTSGFGTNGNNGAPSAAVADAVDGLVELPACTGSIASATAPPGHLCVYVRSDDIVNVADETLNISGGVGAASQGGESQRLGFVVVANAEAAAAIRVRGSWAYTAP